MIGYCAADLNYFKLYFDLWAGQMNKFYPRMRKVVGVFNPTDEVYEKCELYGVECRPAKLTENPERRHFYLMRWLNLPYQDGERILETQVNCLPIATQDFPEQIVDHIRIVRPKRDTTGGLSAAIFSPEAAQRVIEQAEVMLANPPENDHPMNKWQAENLSYVKIKTEQQFKIPGQAVLPETCWITAGTSQHWSAQEKLEILNHYLR